MHPFLGSLKLGHWVLHLPSYGILLALGFSAAYIDSVFKARRLNLDLKHIERLYILIVFGAIAGSRLFHVFFEQFDYYLQNPLKVFFVWEGGYTLYGGLLFCAVCVFTYTRAKKIPFLTFADVAAGATAIGISLGRVGCFLAGCCWGKPTTLPWAVRFDHPDTFCAVTHIPLHPTQLYEACAAFGLYLYLTWRVRHRQYEGQILFHGVVGYALIRFVVEFFRGDESRGAIFDGLLSYSQLVSLLILPLALYGALTKGKGKFIPARR